VHLRHQRHARRRLVAARGRRAAAVDRDLAVRLGGPPLGAERVLGAALDEQLVGLGEVGAVEDVVREIAPPAQIPGRVLGAHRDALVVDALFHGLLL
jgi:hypothetical protein